MQWLSGPAPRLAEVLVTAALWIGLYRLNAWLFSDLMHTAVASWVFLPAALRLLAVLLVDWRGMLGIFVGTLYTNDGMFGAWSAQSFAIAAVSSASPYIALVLMRLALPLARDLSGITPGQLLVLATAGAASSGALHELLFHLLGLRPLQLSELLALSVGDIVGTMLILYALKSAAFLVRQASSLHPASRNPR